MRFLMRHLMVLAILAGVATFPSSAAGQRAGAFEVGGFGSYTSVEAGRFDIVAPRDNRFGGGARLGYFVGERWAVELSSSLTPTDLRANQPGIPSTTGFASVPLTLQPVRAQAIYHVPLTAGVDLLAGGGPSLMTLRRGIRHDAFGASGLVGVRLAPWRRVHLRVEGTYDGFPGGVNGGADHYLGAQVGLSVLVGGRTADAAPVVHVHAPAPQPPAPAPVTLPTAPRPTPAPPKPVVTFVADTVYFAFDRATLTSEGQAVVARAAQHLAERPHLRLEVVGHTDATGTASYNMRLSRARAEAVRTALITAGVAADRVVVRWRGEEEPAASNATRAGRAKNRRVIIGES